jgi:phage shock protein E
MPRIAVAVAVAALAACTPRPPSHPPEPTSASPQHPAPGVIDGETARRLASAGARVVDVRTPQEFAEGHVPGALNIPHEQIRGRVAELGPPGSPVVLYCRSGRRSGIAAQALHELGYANVYDAQRYSAWPRDGGSTGSP